MDGPDLLLRNFLRQRDVGMVRERFLELQRAGVHGGVHAPQVRGSRTDFDIDHAGGGKHLKPGQFNIERRPPLRQGADLSGRRLPFHGQRPRRQHAHVRVGIATWRQFPPKVVQETSQRLGT